MKTLSETCYFFLIFYGVLLSSYCVPFYIYGSIYFFLSNLVQTLAFLIFPNGDGIIVSKYVSLYTFVQVSPGYPSRSRNIGSIGICTFNLPL